MSVKQIELTDRWLGMWSRKLFPYAQQRETEGPVVVVDLDSPAGASLLATAPRHPPQSIRFGYPGKLATSVRGRLKRLQTGANPAELQLGHDCSVEQCTTLLGHLDAKWYQVPRRPSDVERTTLDLCAGGLGAAFFRIGGRTFGSRDPYATRLTFQGAQHLQSLDALTDYDRGREDAERTWLWERWVGCTNGATQWSPGPRGRGTAGRWTRSSSFATKARARRVGHAGRTGCARQSRAVAPSVAGESQGDFRPTADDRGVGGSTAAGGPARRVSG